MRTVKKIFLLNVLLLALGALALSHAEAFAQDAKKPVRLTGVEVSAAEFREIKTVVEAVGTSKAQRSVDVMAVSNGVVQKIAFDEGQLVNEDDVLVQLDAQIERADLAEAEARLKEAQQNLERSLSLRKRDAVAASALDKSILDVEVAKAERERAARRLADRTIKAPFSGRIGFSDIEIGSHLKADEAIAVLDDLSAIKVEFYLPETLFSKVHVGTEIMARASAFADRTFNGSIEAIDTRINESSRSFKVRARIDNEEGILPSGMFLHLSLILDATKALSIPEEAIIVDGAQTFVFAVERDGDLDKVIKTSVKLGRRSFGFVEVTSGISESQRVVTRGVQKVRNGSPVKILNAMNEGLTQ